MTEQAISLNERMHLLSAPARMLGVFGAVFLVLTLGGCADQSMSDLERFVAEKNARKAGKIDPLPPIRPYNVKTYEAGEQKDPFQPFFEAEPKQIEDAIADNGIKPDFNRISEELEQYPLDALRMVGTLEQEEGVWGIVQAPDNTIHRVTIGNYVGQNHGKIIDVQEYEIQLVEIIQDARGRWTERDAGMALAEQE
jgi:type IV pilus assembly protein PilP